MIKTLFISAWYPNRYDEMFGLFVRKHAEAVSLYCDVQVLYVHPSSDIRHFETEIHQSGKLKETIVYFPTSKSGVFSKLLKQINFLRAYLKGWRMLQKSGFRPDIVHANILTRTGLVAYGIHLFTRIPYVITEHWTRYLPLRKSYNGLLRKKITEFVVKHAAAVFPVSENLKNAMISNKLWNKNYFVVNNAVDDVFLTDISKVSETKKIILHVSCFDDQQKNVKGLLNSLKALSVNRNDFKMIFIGTGVDFKEVVDYSVKLNFPEDVIHFVGEKNPAEVAEYMKNADFFVLFSNYENS
ncbi:MAG TPA: glycosyltransferase, partial [Paludibacteraceae bacterium]|nr:glycosyltransferase [Paludibacteraceae bacterium]